MKPGTEQVPGFLVFGRLVGLQRGVARAILCHYEGERGQE